MWTACPHGGSIITDPASYDYSPDKRHDTDSHGPVMNTVGTVAEPKVLTPRSLRSGRTMYILLSKEVYLVKIS